MKDVVFITVQYNNPGDTGIFLKSVGRMNDRWACEVIVVDNSDATLGKPGPHQSGDLAVRTIRTPENLYYWGGAVFALESLFGVSGPWPKWVVVCNNDVEVIDRDFLQILEALDPVTHPVVAPTILSLATGKDQNPLLERHPRWLKRMKWRLYDVSYPTAKALLAIHAAGKRFRNSARTADTAASEQPKARRIYAPHGACMIFSSPFFERGGKLDTHVPLFAEELTIAALAEKLGLAVWYCPQLRISHREHSTIGHTLTRKKYEMERMARRRYYEYFD